MADRDGGSDFMAAEYVDRIHSAHYRGLFEEHRRQEQRILAGHKNQLGAFARNRETAQAQYVQRMRSIEERRDRIADRLHRQHNSLGGRLQAMTKAGRAKQQAQLDRLDDRAAQLQGRATRQFNALTERQFQAEQDDRLHRARQMRHLREDHLEARQAMRRTHERGRSQQIGDRQQTMRQKAEQEWQQAMKREPRQTTEREWHQKLKRAR